MNNALGLVEAIGRAAAIVAVDTILKAANVTLIGIEPSKGGGMYAIKIEGDVGAVKAAVDSIKSLDELQNKILTSKVIPRPAAGIDKLIYNSVTIGYEKKVEDAILEVIQEEVKEAEARELIETNTEVETHNPKNEPTEVVVIEEPIQELAHEVTEEPILEVAEPVAEEPILEVAEPVAEEPVLEVAEPVAEEPVLEVTEPVAEEPTLEAIEAAVEEAAQEVSEVITEEAILEIESSKEQLHTADEKTSSNTKKIEKQEVKKEDVKPTKVVKAESKATKQEVCNLCNDTKCKRKRGEPKSLCIHYNTKAT